MASRALKSGAADFVPKHRLVELAPAVRRALRRRGTAAEQEHRNQIAGREAPWKRAGKHPLGDGDERYRWLVENLRDYAIFLLDPEGRVSSWNQGAELIHLYEAPEAIGQHYSLFFTAEDLAAGKPGQILEV